MYIRVVYLEAIIVKELKEAPSGQQQRPTTDKEKISYPENYETRRELLRVAKKFALVGM